MLYSISHLGHITPPCQDARLRGPAQMLYSESIVLVYLSSILTRCVRISFVWLGQSMLLSWFTMLIGGDYHVTGQWGPGSYTGTHRTVHRVIIVSSSCGAVNWFLTTCTCVILYLDTGIDSQCWYGSGTWSSWRLNLRDKNKRAILEEINDHIPNEKISPVNLNKPAFGSQTMVSHTWVGLDITNAVLVSYKDIDIIET